MGCNAMLASAQTPFRFLTSEAERVARAMASLREDRVDRLCGHSRPFRNQRSSRESQVHPREKVSVRFSPFYYYPFLFASAFPGVTVEALRTLALANRVLLEAILLADKKIDENRPWTPADFCLLDSYFHKALEMLTPLFPLEHAFWHQTQRWFVQHARAILREQTCHRHKLRPYTRKEFFEISTGKVALIKTNLLAMGLLSNTSEILPTLMESQDRFLVGFQCFDDLRDWKEDLQHKNFTFLLTRVLFAGGFHRHLASADSIPLHEVGQILYHRGHAEDQLRMAEHYFQAALESANQTPVPHWVETIRGFLRHCHTMRLDLTEIRRRTTRKTAPKTIAARMQEGIDFMLRASHSSGGFPLARSTAPYMCPSAPLASSRFVTTYLWAALRLLRDMDSRLPELLLEASQWLSLSERQAPDLSLPGALEETFLPIHPNRRNLTELDQSLKDTLPSRPHGLFWAHLLFSASRANIRLARLTVLVQESVRQADYVSWTRFPTSASPASPSNPGVCHPLLALLLFCHACGPDLPQEPLHAYLLKRSRTTGAWNNPTEIALSLLCLLATGYQGPELSSGADRLFRTQEGNGSWPANAVYEQDNLFYGSRALTTAWCLLALFLYHLRTPLPAARKKTSPLTEEHGPIPKIVVNAGLSGVLHACTLSALKDLRGALSPPWPHTLYIGNWPGMPPHFLLNTRESMVVGVNVLPDRLPAVLSTACRPLEAEIAMAMMSAQRCLRLGPLRDRMERIFVAGLALSTSARFLPRYRPWERLGMRKLDWAWCREHEPFLWQELRKFLLDPCPGRPVFQWLLPDPPACPGSPIPKGASLFLGQSLLADALRDEATRPQVDDLLGKSVPAILATFRGKVGLDRDENSFA